MGACGPSSMEREGALVQSVYYGRIGSEATERLLQRFGHDGSFLLRDSDTVQGAYCLCVRMGLKSHSIFFGTYRRAPFVHTYRLIHTSAGWSLQGSEVRLPSCGTLEALIESFRSRSASVAGLVPVTDPLDKSQQHDLSSGPDFVYAEICSRSSADS